MLTQFTRYASLSKKHNFSDINILPRRSKMNSRKDVELKVKYKFKHSERDWEGIPLICSNMDSISNKTMYNTLTKHSIMSCLNKYLTEVDYDLMAIDKTTFMPSMGIKDTDFDKMDLIIEKYSPHFVCIDVANGYMDSLLFAIDKFYERYYKSNITLCVGNVVTPERVELLINDFGVDIVKVGIGSGGVCTTTSKTGIGYPQFSAVLECADAAKSLGGHIISDGGIKSSSDIAKALSAGADFVMLGSMIAGHYGCNGEVITKDGEHFMKFYGMSSAQAMNKHSGGIDDYRTAEGKEVLVPLKGDINDTLKDVFGSLRSTCTYVGAQNLSELYDNTRFIVV